MTSKHWFALGLAALLGLVWAGGAAVRAQSSASDRGQPRDEAQAQPPGEGGQGAEAGQAKARAAAGDESGPQAETKDIDELLAGEEQVLAGEGYSYDPESRRDPFKSLLVTTRLPNFRGPRPEGIPGLLIDEVIVTGIFRTDKGYVAQVQSAENEKSYLVKKGDQLYDGDIVRITDNEIVFKQIVQDPTALKPFREVVKTLNPEKKG
jgi:Tfp pilus assembly protein PilP